MADVFANRVRETTTTSGTGTLSLAGAALGHKAFSTLAVGATCTYCLEDADSINWEIGRATVGALNTLVRTTVYEGTNGTSPISLSVGTHQVYLTLTSDLFEHAVVTPEQFGAVGDGVTDDTAAIQAAINSFPGGNGSVFLPRASYKTTSMITIAQNGIEIRGSGLHSTTLIYTPVANGSCIKFSHGASVLYACQIRDMAIYSADATYTKTAVEVIDASGFIADNLSISGNTGGPGYWSGADSIGISIAGRESGRYQRLVVTADHPLVVKTNPNSALSIDHHHFQDLYLTANACPCVEFLSGVNVSNVTFDGTQAWVDGSYGFYWNDTTSSIQSYQLTIRGVRQEQSTDAASYQIYISHNTNLQGLNVADFYGTQENNHCYLRNVLMASFQNVIYTSGTKIAMNAVAVSGSSLSFVNCTYQPGSTATLTNYVEQISMKKLNASDPIPQTAYYCYQLNGPQDYIEIGGVKTSKFIGSLTDGSSFDFRCGPGYGISMSLIHVAAHGATKDEGGSAFNGGSTPFRMGGTANFVVTNTAGKLCITNDGVFVSLLNNLGETVSYVADVTLG